MLVQNTRFEGEAEALRQIKGPCFLQVELQFGRAGAGGSAYQDLTRQDVEDERHMDVLERVLVSTTTRRSPTPVKPEKTGIPA